MVILMVSIDAMSAQHPVLTYSTAADMSITYRTCTHPGCSWVKPICYNIYLLPEILLCLLLLKMLQKLPETNQQLPKHRHTYAFTRHRKIYTYFKQTKLLSVSRCLIIQKHGVMSCYTYTAELWSGVKLGSAIQLMDVSSMIKQRYTTYTQMQTFLQKLFSTY